MSNSILTPELWLKQMYEGSDLTIEEIGVAPIVIGCWGYSLVEKMAEMTGGVRVERWLYGTRHPLFNGSIGGRTVSFSHYPNGAAGTVKIMEELRAAGASTFITLGWTGALQSNMEIGDMVIPTGVVSDEGTSPNYVPETESIRAHPRLVKTLAEESRNRELTVHEGKVWSTDACYRETRELVARYCGQGVLGVDFESAGVLAFGQYRDVRTANILVVSDKVAEQWAPGFRDQRHFESTMKGLDVMLAVAEDLLADD